MLNAAASNAMDNYSSDTVQRFRRLFDSATNGNLGLLAYREKCKQVVADTCERTATPQTCRAASRHECDSIPMRANVNLKFHLIHVRFEAVDSPSDRERRQGIATRLELPRRHVQLLIYWARRLLTESKEYQAVLGEMNAMVDPGQ